MPAPRLSVVMAVYNDARTVLQAADSILWQTFTHFEFIIVDDGSTDGTSALLEALDDPRLVLIRNVTNLGQTRALNRGLAEAKGAYVTRQDSDDVSLPERLARQVARMDAHPEIGMLGTRALYVTRRGKPLRVYDVPTEHAAICERLRVKNSFHHGVIMLRREVVAAVGGYREGFRLAQDYDLALRVAERFTVANLPDVLYHALLGSESAAVRKNSDQDAYAALARQLARERREFGAERTSLAEAAAHIELEVSARRWWQWRLLTSDNYAFWAGRLAGWGRHAWPEAAEAWLRAVAAFPPNPRPWMLIVKGILRRPYHLLRRAAGMPISR